METTSKGLPKLEVMPQLSTQGLVRETACQWEPIPCTQQTQPYTKSLLQLSAANFFPAGIFVRETKTLEKSALPPLSISALLLCWFKLAESASKQVPNHF